MKVTHKNVILQQENFFWQQRLCFMDMQDYLSWLYLCCYEFDGWFLKLHNIFQWSTKQLKSIGNFI